MVYLFKHLFPKFQVSSNYTFVRVYEEVELNIRALDGEPFKLFYDYRWRYQIASTTKFNDNSLYALRDLHKILEAPW
jgi:hypothetical protein